MRRYISMQCRDNENFDVYLDREQLSLLAQALRSHYCAMFSKRCDGCVAKGSCGDGKNRSCQWIKEMFEEAATCDHRRYR